MDRTAALLATFAVGALLAFQPPANAQLGRLVGDLGAAFTSLMLSAGIVGVLLLLSGQAGGLRDLSGFRPEHALGAVGGAAVVLVTLVAVRSRGAGVVTAALVLTQLTVSAVIDRLGILGLDGDALSAHKVVGFALLAAGTVLVTLR